MMLQLSTSSNQTLSPGDLLVFDTISFWTGHDECFDDRRPTFANLTVPNGVYEVIFDAALGYQASPIRELNLALLLQGRAIPEAVMALTPIPPLRFFLWDSWNIPCKSLYRMGKYFDFKYRGGFFYCSVWSKFKNFKSRLRSYF